VVKTLQDLRESVLAADEEAARATVSALLEAEVEPRLILEDGLAAAMLELGQRWNRGEAFLVEVVASAEVFRQCSEIVEPALVARGQKKAGHLVVIGTVQGDLHDLGKNIVGAMLKTAGFEVRDLGRDVSAERFTRAVVDLKPSLLGLSALLTTTMLEQKVVIEALKAAGIREEVRVLVGGAPVTAEWAAEIGADAYAANAPQAVEVALNLVEAGGDHK
jgi:corrinoid protein of di/trimethylamine methyltransferase